MRVSVVRPAELTSDLLSRWSALQKANPTLGSPYFRPEFTLAVARARPDTRVALIDDGAAFFPFHRERFGIGRPVGGRLSDYHGLIGPSELQFDAAQLIRSAGLRLWDFDHVPAVQNAFLPSTKKHAQSPQIDLSLAEAGGSAKLREQAMNRRRKLGREIGPMELEFNSLDPAMLRQCWQWKAEQYQRTGLGNILAVPWVANALSAIFEARGDEFSGVLSVLRAGGRPVAIHFGMQARNVFHYWFPCYDPEFSIYSPGILLLLEIVDATAAQGVTLIDLGKGDAFYKGRLSNAAAPLLEGCVHADAWSRVLAHSRDATRQLVRSTPMRRSLGGVVRMLKGRG